MKRTTPGWRRRPLSSGTTRTNTRCEIASTATAHLCRNTSGPERPRNWLQYPMQHTAEGHWIPKHHQEVLPLLGREGWNHFSGQSTITEQENRTNIEMQARKQILFVKLSATSALVQSCTLSLSVLTFSVLVFTQNLCTPHIPHNTILSPCTNLNSSVLAIPKPLHFPTIPER